MDGDPTECCIGEEAATALSLLDQASNLAHIASVFKIKTYTAPSVIANAISSAKLIGSNTAVRGIGAKLVLHQQRLPAPASAS